MGDHILVDGAPACGSNGPVEADSCVACANKIAARVENAVRNGSCTLEYTIRLDRAQLVSPWFRDEGLVGDAVRHALLSGQVKSVELDTSDCEVVVRGEF